jgi:hypothetical protein
MSNLPAGHVSRMFHIILVRDLHLITITTSISKDILVRVAIRIRNFFSRILPHIDDFRLPHFLIIHYTDSSSPTFEPSTQCCCDTSLQDAYAMYTCTGRLSLKPEPAGTLTRGC